MRNSLLVNLIDIFKLLVPEWGDHFLKGGFFFSKKETRKRSKKKTKGKKKEEKKIKEKEKEEKTRKHPKEPNNRKFSDTSYPYRVISKKQAIKEFLSLREMVKKKDFNSKSVLGNRVVDYGTEKMRKKQNTEINLIMSVGKIK